MFKMDINTVVTLIGSLGFPIVMCLILVYMIAKMETSHKEEISKLTESLNNNTQTIQTLDLLLRKALDISEEGE